VRLLIDAKAYLRPCSQVDEPEFCISWCFGFADQIVSGGSLRKTNVETLNDGSPTWTITKMQCSLRKRKNEAHISLQ
jgi:hypothetical protein